MGYLYFQLLRALPYLGHTQKGGEIAADRPLYDGFIAALFPNTHMEWGVWRQNPALQLSLLFPCSVVCSKWNNATPVSRYNSSFPCNVKH